MNPLTIRKWHGYIGMFIAPGVLFFSLTGTVQLFSLHEAHGGYHPPALLEKLGKLHTDQVFAQKQADPDDHPEAATAASGLAAADDHEHHDVKKAPRVTVYFLKWFCTFVALGLFISTSFGIWMGLQQALRRRTHVILLLVGVIVPVILIVI